MGKDFHVSFETLVSLDSWWTGRCLAMKFPVAFCLSVALFALPWSNAQQSPTKGRRPRQKWKLARSQRETCYEGAGIPKSVIEQRKNIRKNTQTQLRAVCTDPSLNGQQKTAKINEIRKAERQQIEGLLTTEQRERPPQASGRGGPNARGLPRRGGNPCDEILRQ